jgi:hypothetical protein
MKKTMYLFMCLFVVFASGCAATGPKYSSYHKMIPAIPAGKGRIYFYRDASMMGGAIRPDIKLNGKAVGESLPGGFFFVDTAPGKYSVSTSTEVERTLEFTLAPAETKYVRTSITMGFFAGHVAPGLVSKEEAEKALVDLSFAGKYDANHPKQE